MTMASHADEGFVDSSGYTPSLEDIAELRRKLHLHHTTFLPGAAWIADCPPLCDSAAAVGDAAACVLRLSLDDLKEIEDAFAYFSGT